MDDQPSSAPPSTGSQPEDRLDSWKEIAAYLKRDVTTVQRWEKREGMPVHRHLHDKQGSVYAFRNDLDAWARGRKGAPAPEDAGPERRTAEAAPEAEPAPRGPSRVRLGIVAAAAAALLAGGILWLAPRQSPRTDPLAEAQFRTLTDFDGIEQAAAVSRDGRFVAFQSDRDGRMDIWVTQVGTGQFYNLTQGGVSEIVNPAVRTLGFSPDGTLVTFWTRRPGASGSTDIGVWAVPTLGGEARPYLEGAAEFDWSGDGKRLVYHTPAVGDPMFVRDAREGDGRLVFTAAPGLHAHFPLWSPDQSFIYFVQGTVTDAMDIWRIPAAGGAAERITHHNARVSHPVILDGGALAYLAAAPDGSGLQLFALPRDARVPRRVGSGMDRYTSLSASADGRRLVATLASPKGTLWRLALSEPPAAASEPVPISLTTASGFSPRLGPGYMIYVSSRGASDSLWKLADGRTAQLWTAPDARIVGHPQIDREGGRIAFTTESAGRTLLHVVNTDGTDARVVTSSLALRGAPAWSPRGAITSAVSTDGVPRLADVALDGTTSPLVGEYSTDPVWAPDGRFVVYFGADVGTTFPIKAAAAGGGTHAMPDLMLTRGSRRARFTPDGRSLVVLRGDIQHKDLWRIDLATGDERRLTQLPAGFSVRDFDVSPDGREVVLERIQEHSDVVLLEMPGRSS